ncbi:MAG: hypothetical protein ABIO19_04455 [Burkholderiaceae bacterium]
MQFSHPSLSHYFRDGDNPLFGEYFKNMVADYLVSPVTTQPLVRWADIGDTETAVAVTAFAILDTPSPAARFLPLYFLLDVQLRDAVAIHHDGVIELIKISLPGSVAAV